MSHNPSRNIPGLPEERGTILPWRTRTTPVKATPPPLPSPEKVFADWLVSLPNGVDLAAAARQQIDAIDRRASGHPDVQYLRTLLLAVAGECTWRRNTRSL